MIRLGFIGCGNHATQNLYPCLRYADAELVAVADLDESRRDYCRHSFGAQQGYADYNRMLQEVETDAVFVCGPPELHYAAGKAVLESGRHLFVEKPPAPSLQETRELAVLARGRGLVAGVGFMKREAQKYLQAKQLIGAGGVLRHALVRYSYNVEGDASRVFPLMCVHAIDLALWLLDGATGIDVTHGRGSRADVYATLHGRSGAIATLIMNAGAPGVVERVELTGDETMVVVDEVGTLEYLPKQTENRWRPVVREVHRPNTALQTVANTALELQGYRGEVVRFVEAATGAARYGAARESDDARQRFPAATMDDAVRVMEIVDAMLTGTDGHFELTAGAEK